MIFSELLHASRDHLVAGNGLLLAIEAEIREDQVRMTCSKISPLEDALEHKIRAIKISMDSAAAAGKIKELLEQGGSGTSQVSVSLRLPDGRLARMDIPGRWRLGGEARDVIRAQDGVLEVAEV